MLLISTRLGIIACRYLVKAYYRGEWTTAPEIASYYNMNVRSLMPALQRLVKAGILRSRVGGINRGFFFLKSPTEVTLSDILAALEGTISTACCKDMIKGVKCDCNSTQNCSVHCMFCDIIEDTQHRLRSVTAAAYAGVSSDMIVH